MSMVVSGGEWAESWTCSLGVPAAQGLLLSETHFFSSFFRCPAWLKIRCTYLMAEPSQGPLNQGRMGARRLIGIWEDWEVFLGCRL